MFENPETLERISKTNIEKYGVDNPFKSSEIQGKIQGTIRKREKRPKVAELKKYREKYNLKYDTGWTRKKDEYIEQLYEEVVQKYGDL